MHMQRQVGKPPLKLVFRQEGEYLICYLPAGRQILFPYGKTRVKIGGDVSAFETCGVVSQIAKADKDPNETSINSFIKESEQPCLALSRLLYSLSKTTDEVIVYEDRILFKSNSNSKSMEDNIGESIGAYYSHRESGGGTVFNMYRVCVC